MEISETLNDHKMKQYILENVSYGYSRSDRKWRFVAGDNTVIIICPEGKISADKFATQMNAAYKRSKGKNILDGIARKNINKIEAAVNAED